LISIVPISLKEANEYVELHHRHHGSVRGHKFSIAASVDGRIVGVVIAGRPVSRHQDDGWTLEVLRLATDGERNVCSALYAAAWRAAKAMGYTRMGTYIPLSETGTSLKAAGWQLVHQTKGGSWPRKPRPRVDLHPTEPKLRYEVCA
jgi:hypothetical protein